MKVLVVGGGIAGLSCALHLLRAGHRVCVAEKLRGPIDKVCGEGILPFGVRALRELGLWESARAAGRPFSGITYRCGARAVTGHFPSGTQGLGIARHSLDSLLREACGRYPHFEIHEGRRSRPGDRGDFDRVLAADGIHSSWARHLGVKKSFGSRLGLRFRIVAESAHEVQIHFFPEGEVYLTPLGKRSVSVAFLVEAAKLGVNGGDLRAWASSFFRSRFPEYRQVTVGEIGTRGPIASRLKSRPPDVPLLGDALCAYDPISGAGMSFALLCGKWAAAHLDDPVAYYRAMSPVRRGIGSFTDTLLFFRGGGFKTRLMLRQLARSPGSFARMLALHDGNHGFSDLGLSAFLPLLRLW